MTGPAWQLQTPINTIVFDCDGTLSSIEGIDELARMNGASKTVEELTAKAMGLTGLNPDLYQKRLELVKPTQEQIDSLGQHYYQHIVPDIADVLSIFKRLNKNLYIVSAGLQPAVETFGKLLGISPKNIFAVKITFDVHGNYVDFDRTSSLARRDGKREIVEHLKMKHQDILFIGDGLNDLAALDLVTRFIGYGGSFYRANIAERCQFYINHVSMSPLLPLCLTKKEVETLSVAEKKLYDAGVDIINGKHVILNEMH